MTEFEKFDSLLKTIKEITCSRLEMDENLEGSVNC